MRDLAFVAYIAAFLALGFKRPFLLVLAYVYVTVVSPQRLSYYMLNSIPLSLLVVVLAVAAWFIADDKKDFRITPRQWLMGLLLLYAGYTTWNADLPLDALSKWDWAWKAVAFAIFLPWALRTKLRIEALLLFLVLTASTIIVTGGIKTAASGGGYGSLNLMVTNNSGLYEGSILSTFAIALIPIVLWFTRHGTIFPPDWRVKGYAACLMFACLLIPVGTEARTGLVCIAVLAVLMLRDVKRRILYVAAAGLIGLAAIPFLPQSYTERMGTISTYRADSSATTRIAVWKWTWDYVQKKPLGGGFEAYRQNKIEVATVATTETGQVQVIAARTHDDEGRAYHSSYFEMLGEQGFPGLFLFLLIHGTGLVRMEVLRRRYRKPEAGQEWISPLATALQHFHIIYLVGSLFVAIAFQPFIWMMIAAQIAFDSHVSVGERKRRAAAHTIRPPKLRPAPAA
jgi:probable O-glycosylation ligase (exosortase A-associated)